VEGTAESIKCWPLTFLFSLNTDVISPEPDVADDANEQLNVNGTGEPTVVLAAVGFNGIPPTAPHT